MSSNPTAQLAYNPSLIPEKSNKTLDKKLKIFDDGISQSMDPKTLAGLDPKLRETYEKVMGTQTSTPSTPTASSNFFPDQKNPTDVPSSIPAPTPPEPPSIDSEDKIADSLQQPLSPQPPPAPATPQDESPVSPVEPTLQPLQPSDLATIEPGLSQSPFPDAPEATNNPVKPIQPLPSPASINNPKSTPTTKSTNPILKTIYLLTGTIFFIAYAVFWMRIFDFPLPFDLPFASPF